MRSTKYALPMKLAWGLIYDRDRLQDCMLKGKDGTSNKFILVLKNKPKASAMWKGLYLTWPSFEKGLQ